MPRCGKHPDELLECRVESVSRLVCAELGQRGLATNDVLELGNDRGHQPTVGAQSVAQSLSPLCELGLASAQELLHQGMKGLREASVGNVTLALVKLAGEEESAGAPHVP